MKRLIIDRKICSKCRFFKEMQDIRCEKKFNDCEWMKKGSTYYLNFINQIGNTALNIQVFEKNSMQCAPECCTQIYNDIIQISASKPFNGIIIVKSKKWKYTWWCVNIKTLFDWWGTVRAIGKDIRIFDNFDFDKQCPYLMEYMFLQDKYEKIVKNIKQHQYSDPVNFSNKGSAKRYLAIARAEMAQQEVNYVE